MVLLLAKSMGSKLDFLMPEASSVQFTVGKIDAGLAILLSADNHVLEFPSAMLPVS
jgi:predicted Na+-dependent transporter